MRLSKFLKTGEYAGACSALSKGWPGIALPPGSARYKTKNKDHTSYISHSKNTYFYMIIHTEIQTFQCKKPHLNQMKGYKTVRKTYRQFVSCMM
jgi:hypothetical protein